MADELEARLQSHAKAFEGMLALIPADYYYGKDSSDQWSKKKQTKEEKRAAKKAKLDPANYKTALDVHREREQKRKRELDEEDGMTAEGDIVKQPQESLKRDKKHVKKQKVEHGEAKDQPKPEKKPLTPEKDEAIRREKAERRRQKRERKKEQKQQKQARKEAQKAQKRPIDEEKVSSPRAEAAPSDGSKPKKSGRSSTSLNGPRRKDSKLHDAGEGPRETNEVGSSENDDSASKDEEESADAPELSLNTTEMTTAPAPESDSDSDDQSSEDRDTPTFDESGQQSSASSTSSIVPPSEPQTTASKPQTALQSLSSIDSASTSRPEPTIDAEQESESGSEDELSEKPAFAFEEAPTAPDDDDSQGSSKHGDKSHKLPEIDQAKLKERLEARLTTLRAARKADGPNGKPARNRQDLIDARRQKEERRKQHKKELRQKAKAEQSAEAEAARLRGGSGSPMWIPNAILSPREPQNSFSFGRVAFGNGDELDTGAGAIVDGKKRKGPQDVKTALEAAKKKQNRISGFDDEKRKDIEEKDRWLNAKKRVQGEKIRDNTSLLKKTLKRKEKGKAKSEKEWNERIEGVQAGKEAKQKKREDNLRKRKEEKGGGKKGAPKAAPKPKRRPGFEGSWKLGSKGGRSP